MVKVTYGAIQGSQCRKGGLSNSENSMYGSHVIYDEDRKRGFPKVMGAILLLAVVCGVVLASQSSQMEVTRNTRAIELMQNFQILNSTNNATTAAPAAPAAAVPAAAAAGGNATAADPAVAEEEAEEAQGFHFKGRIPLTWESFIDTFGYHFYGLITVIIFGLLTWIFIAAIKPMIPRADNSEPLMDENNIVGNLVILPGEEVFFNQEEPFTLSMWEMLLLGCHNRVWKLAVTNHRLVAQKREATCFGTLQITAREDCWPAKCIHKVSVISGEFWGYSIATLIDLAVRYMLVALLFDCLHKVVREFIEEIFGVHASEPEVVKLIMYINIGLYVLCNVLFVLAVIYSIAAMMLLIFPHSLVKVYLTWKMEEDGHPIQRGCCCSCGGPNSKPMETFTFRTENSYKAYQAIMAAQAGAGNPEMMSSKV